MTDSRMLEIDTSTVATGFRPSSGGPAAIYGFVHQLTASISQLIEAQFGATGRKVDLETVTAILEPAGGGDLRIEQARRRVLQFKHRSRPVSIGELGESVLPDLFSAHIVREAAAYELHTTIGLSRPGHALVARLRAHAEASDAVDPADPPLQALLARLRAIFSGAGGPVGDFGASLARFIARLMIAPSYSADEARQEVLAFLRQKVTFAEEAPHALDQLIGFLAQSARVHGASISIDMLLARLGLPGARHGQPDAARTRLGDALARSLALRDYDATRDVRSPILANSTDPLTLVVGRSGHGKSWALYRLAVELSHAGKPATLVRAADLNELERALRLTIASEALAQQKLTEAGLLGQMWQRMVGPSDTVITVLWEGCRDVSILQTLRVNGGLGPGLALVAEAPVAEAAHLSGFEQIPVHSVDAFTPSQLFDALRRRGVSAGPIPQPIRQMLQLPVLCGIYSTLAAERPHWDPETEYRVLEGFWGRGRERAGKLTGTRLKAFARHLLAARLTSAGDDEMARLGFTETELEALIGAGWLSDIGGRWQFGHDRLLTWAIAMAMVADVELGKRDAVAVAAEVIELQGPRSKDKRQLTGLGFLLMDVVWLMAALPGRTSDLVDLLERFEPEAVTSVHTLYTDLLPTAGRRMLPAIEMRIARAGPDFDRVEGHLVTALRQLDLTGAEQVALCARLWDGHTPQGRSIAVSLGRLWPLTAQRDGLWEAYCALNWTTEVNSDEQELFERMAQALERLACLDPAWLADLIAITKEPDDLWLATFLLKALDPATAAPIWPSCRAVLLDRLPAASHKVLLDCIARFGDSGDGAFLEAIIITGGQHSAEALATLVEVDAVAALALIERLPQALTRFPYGRYWLDRLLDLDACRAATALQRWLLQADPSGEDLADLWTRAEERVPRDTLRLLLDRLAEAIGDLSESEGGLRRHDRFALLGSLTLDPVHEPLFHAWRGTDLSAALRRRAIAHFDGAHDGQYVEVRRLLRRIGGDDYEALVMHALSPDELTRAYTGIQTAILLPTPAVRARLAMLADHGIAPEPEDGEGHGPLLDLWRTLLDLDPDGWRPRLLGLLHSDDEATVLLGLHLLEEYPGPDDDTWILASFERCAPGGKVELQTMNHAGNRGCPTPEMVARAIARVDGAELGSASFADLNVLLEDPGLEGRALFDRYLAPLENARSWNSVDSAALSWRVRLDDVPPGLWRAAERMMNTGFFSGDRFVGSVLKHNPQRAIDVLLDRAFAKPDILTTAQPDAIALLATVDKPLGTEAFAQAWRDHPRRREHLARHGRAFDDAAIDAMIESLSEEYGKARPSRAYRLICVELRHEHSRALDRLVARFRTAPASERLALCEPIAWAAEDRALVSVLAAGEADPEVRHQLDAADRHWRYVEALVTRFRTTRSFEDLEQVIDIADPRPLLQWDDPLRLVELINEDSRLTGYAERRFVGRLNEIEGTKLKRVVIRHRVERPSNGSPQAA